MCKSNRFPICSLTKRKVFFASVGFYVNVKNVFGFQSQTKRAENGGLKNECVILSTLCKYRLSFRVGQHLRVIFDRITSTGHDKMFFRLKRQFRRGAKTPGRPPHPMAGSVAAVARAKFLDMR